MNGQAAIRTLLPQECRLVSLRSDSLFNHAAFKEYVTDHPASTFVNERYEYLVVDRWKSRDEIAEIIEMGGPSGHPLSPHGRGEQPWSVRRKALLTGALDLIRAQGLHMVLVGEVEARRSLSAYLDAGFTEVEHIVAYRSVQPLILPPDTRLTVHPLTVSDLDDLVRLEQETFPWLWWFGVDEWLL
ncbi:MAG: hypothetical protein M1296_04935, partial [Chloroflexi bacterium]|nr:hypothetical protein [Chloroflexota bacterium]